SLQAELEAVVPPSREAMQAGIYLKSVRGKEKVKPAKKADPEPPLVELQIYFPNKPEHLELSSFRRSYFQGQTQVWLIPFSPPEKLDWLRIDPGQYPGTYLLRSWAFLDGKQTTLFKWTPESKSSITCQLTGVTLGPITNQGQEIWSLTHDPQLLFAPLPPEIDHGSVRWLSIEFAATEIESPLANPLRLRRKTKQAPDEDSQDLPTTIDSVLATLERRKSTMLRMIDRIRKKIKG
ncbi:MAG: hypothetical protein O7C75_17050, partial [Verrucomicrobia bacterium]|nr:hypothetical protein [Verrucomicrobiota bacterium]